MPDISIELKDDQLGQVLGAHIVASISEGQRDKLITDSLAYLLRPEKQSYGAPSKSPLQYAFDNALSRLCAQVVQEMVANDDEMMAKVREAVRASFEAVLEHDDTLRENIGRAIASTLAERR